MQVLAREYGLMVYPLDAKLTAVLAQVAAGYPVMARIGGGLWSDAHYVVVVGFNQQKSTVLLRSGMDRRLLMSFGDFESKWKSAGNWAILTQRPSQLPANVDAQRWRDAAFCRFCSQACRLFCSCACAQRQPPARCRAIRPRAGADGAAWYAEKKAVLQP